MAARPLILSRPSRRMGYCLPAFASPQKDITEVEARERRLVKTTPCRIDWDDHADVVAAGSSCQAPECGELAFASGPADRSGRDHAILREFTCLRCEINFAVPEFAVPNQDELIFQGAQWLLPRVQYA